MLSDILLNQGHPTAIFQQAGQSIHQFGHSVDIPGLWQPCLNLGFAWLEIEKNKNNTDIISIWYGIYVMNLHTS